MTGSIVIGDVDGYLRRIGYLGPREPTLATLQELHEAHLRTVPFENLDIGLGRPILLDAASLTEKIVRRRRGGYCYELNGLFALLLRELGFRVDLLSARVARDGGEFSPEFDHLALHVHVDGSWLADVGFGDLFLRPIRLDGRGEWVEPWRAFRLTEDDGGRILWMREDGEDWKAQYAFSLTPHRIEEFETRNRWQQTSPESHFTRKRVCSLATDGGRVTLSDLRLIETHGRTRTECVLTDSEWTRTLRDTFGIVL